MSRTLARGVSVWLLVTGLGGCGDDPPTPAPPPTRLASAAATLESPSSQAFVTADTATVEAPLTLTAQLYVENDAVVFARSPGVVESLLVDLGRRVGAGQTLARLESVDQTLALQQAQNRLLNARQRVERQRALKARDVVTAADAEQVEFEFREAGLNVQKAKRELDLTRIVAPFSGVVTARSARVGRLVGDGDTLFRLTALGPLLAAVRLPETSAFTLRIGDGADVLTAAGARVHARVVRASPMVDAASGTREVVLQLAPRSGLMPGGSVSVRVGAERRRVVALPRDAVGADGSALVWDGQHTSVRNLTLGAPLPNGRVEIVGGLAAGERVVAGGP